MITLNEVMHDLIGMEVTEDFNSNVICEFGDYEFNGETEVIVNKIQNSNNWEAYINEYNSPILELIVKNNKVIDVKKL